MRSSAFSVSHSRVSSPERGAKRSPIPTPIPSPIRKFVVPRPLLYTTALLCSENEILPVSRVRRAVKTNHPAGPVEAAVKRLYGSAESSVPTGIHQQMNYEATL